MTEQFYSDLIAVVLSFFIFLLLIFFIVITLAVRYRKRKKENETLRVEFSEQLLKSQLEIQEETLQFVSRELHDNIGQIASLIKINLNTMPLENLGVVQTKVNNTKELVKQLITDIKLLSTSLNGDKLNKVGLMQSLQNEADRINKTGAFVANFEQDATIPAIHNDKAIILYRMVQEVLNNALKHSGAKEISIRAGVDESNRFILTIKDDGKGFDVEEKLKDSKDTGNGLLNLQQRAKVINGYVNFVSSPGKGSTTIITTTV
ncbi:MAG: hypothetical protein EOO03_05745 [Chitinophagaceae bacterium]|nr:MAG: hypothetical protein EOO03_05745 [Chitinophagaceae bacterium]